MERRTTTIIGTAVLGSLVVVFDYTLKFSGWKIPFPWLPDLKFDFTGIPIVLSLLLYGLRSGATTSSIAFLAILIRSSNYVGASMKALAEFSMILGMFPFINRTGKIWKAMAVASGLALRVLVMSLFGAILFPTIFLPLQGVFNIMLGSVNIFSGFLIHKALVGRMPSIANIKNSSKHVAADKAASSI